MSHVTPDLTDRPEEWPVISSVDLHRDDWVMALRADRIQRPGAEGEEPFRRLVLEHPGAVIVLALDDQERVCLLRQYRHAAGRRFVELPAGLLDVDGEGPEATARRELREEVGLEASDWVPLGSTYSSPGISSEVMHLFLARGLSSVGREGFTPEHEEADMETLWAPYADLHRAVLEGRLTDAPLVLAVLLAAARGLVGSPARGE